MANGKLTVEDLQKAAKINPENLVRLLKSLKFAPIKDPHAEFKALSTNITFEQWLINELEARIIPPTHTGYI